MSVTNSSVKFKMLDGTDFEITSLPKSPGLLYGAGDGAFTSASATGSQLVRGDGAGVDLAQFGQYRTIWENAEGEVANRIRTEFQHNAKGFIFFVNYPAQDRGCMPVITGGAYGGSVLGYHFWLTQNGAPAPGKIQLDVNYVTIVSAGGDFLTLYKVLQIL